MDTTHALVILVLVLAFGVVSGALSRWVVTGPMVFGVAGVALSKGAGWLGLEPLGEGESLVHAVELLGEATLAVLLFTDAARIDLGALRRDGAAPARLLLIAMPLTIALGAVAAWPLLPGLGVWELLVVGAILAPTDAALGQAVVTSQLVPERVRQTLSVESGLNDGIALPLVVVFASIASIGHAVAGHADPMTPGECARFAASQVLIGPAVGGVVGVAGSVVLCRAKARGWILHDYLELSGLALALVAALAADTLGGNAFIAAFVGGLAFGAWGKGLGEALYDFADAEGTLLMLVTFLFAGAVLAADTLDRVGWQELAYAGLSLTVVRMAPVYLAYARSGASPATRAFVGWFGPRGLASILFVVLLLGELATPHADRIRDVAIVTVSLSVVLHGATAAPLARRYGELMRRSPCPSATRPCPHACYRTNKPSASGVGHTGPASRSSPPPPTSPPT